MLPNKWHRVGISSAGMLVEIVLASICTFLWWFSEPGLLNTLCLNVMFICSVSTILLNGNPLLRYDGYYILSDVLEVPNLSQQSRALLGRGLARGLLGMELPADRSLSRERRGLVAAYGVASAAYRWFVVIAILWFCHKVSSGYRLELVAEAMAVVVIGGLLMGPIWNLTQAVRNPGWRQRVQGGRLALSAGAAIVLAAAVLLVPLPFRVTAPVVLQPEGGHRVYVLIPGRLSSAVREGAEVEPQAVGRRVLRYLRRTFRVGL